MTNSYLIQSLDNPTRFWHTQKGWTTRADAHTFDEETRESSMHEGGFVLPEGGRWILVSQPEPLPHKYVPNNLLRPGYCALTGCNSAPDAPCHMQTERPAPESTSDEPRPRECGAAPDSAGDETTEDAEAVQAGGLLISAIPLESIAGATTLLPCPFCGSDAQFSAQPPYREEESEASVFWAAHCSSCEVGTDYGEEVEGNTDLPLRSLIST